MVMREFSKMGAFRVRPWVYRCGGTYAGEGSASNVSWARGGRALLTIKIKVLVKDVTLDIVPKKLRRSLLDFSKGLKVLI